MDAIRLKDLEVQFKALLQFSQECPKRNPEDRLNVSVVREVLGEIEEKLVNDMNLRF